ncbi:MAG: transcriptional regulator [Methanobacteriaceae archaeon]|nr:transcriptional regulator [Methanobacteriaceae archaeon]
MQRNEILKEINELLLSQGFESSHIYDRSCFDMVARKKFLLLLLKVLINIDGFTGKQAEEIKKLAHYFLASPLIVGLKSKKEYLEEDVVYERHGIPVIALETLRNIIIEDIYPEIFADRGGYFVQIDGKILSEIREKQNLSLKDLADMAHVSRETIYKYEHGLVRACPETVMMLENILNLKITLSVDLFKIPQKPDKEPIEFPKAEPKELVDLGFGVIPTNRTPFDAIAKTDLKTYKERESNNQNSVITNMEKNRTHNILKKMALSVKDLSEITGSNAVFIFENRKKLENIKGIPVVHNWEIEDMENSGEFIKLVKERKECN